MNRLENWFCSTKFWSGVTQNRLLPWMLQGVAPCGHVLELGAGPGAATPALRRKFPRVTSLEYSAAFAAKLRRNSPGSISSQNRDQHAGRIASVVQGDATQLPFADESFSCAIAILMLHHLRSPELQDRAFTEIRRVLKPGGTFLAFEINDGWLQRTMHIGSTFVPIAAGAANARLNAAGFSRVAVDFRRGGFLLRAQRAESQNGNF
jgi:ubiquinone/menaquinone biosynthesis C-methylase UbiE